MRSSTPSTPIDWTLIEKVLTDTASADERVAANALLQDREDLRQLLNTLGQEWTTPYRQDHARTAQESLVVLTQRIEADGISATRAPGTGVPAVSSSVSPRSSSVGLRWPSIQWPTVAALVVGVLLLVVGWQGGVRDVTLQMADRVSTYTTANGQQSTITLPDGSTVVLNVGSRLEVPANFAAGNRTLHLTGEAFFSVIHHTTTPFTVVSGPHSTRVLGTSFTVRRYRTDSLTTVAVRDGRVALDTVVVAAQQRVRMNPRGISMLDTVDSDAFSFSNGILTLDGIPLPEAIIELNRWYDADIRLGDPSLASLRVKGKLATGSIADLASLFDLLFKVRIVRDGRILTLYPRQ